MKRKEAKALGLKKFVPDNPCNKCGTSERRAANSRCLFCAGKSNKKYYKEHRKEGKVRVKKWYYENLERTAVTHKKWMQNNRLHVNKYNKKIREKNKENPLWIQKNKEYMRSYNKAHEDRLKQKAADRRKKNKNQRNAQDRNRRKTDVIFKLVGILRGRLNKAVQNNQKVGSAVRDLGCPIGFFKNYLASQFEPWMTWKNWKLKPTKEHPRVWHIDHIKPLASFDLADSQQFLEATHYTNMRPLESTKNLTKGAKYKE